MMCKSTIFFKEDKLCGQMTQNKKINTVGNIFRRKQFVFIRID